MTRPKLQPPPLIWVSICSRCVGLIIADIEQTPTSCPYCVGKTRIVYVRYQLALPQKED